MSANIGTLSVTRMRERDFAKNDWRPRWDSNSWYGSIVDSRIINDLGKADRAGERMFDRSARSPTPLRRKLSAELSGADVSCLA